MATTTGTGTYRAAVVRTPAGADAIEIIDVPVVEPGPGQVRVRIAAAAVNPVDLGVVAGVFHALGLVHQPDHTGLGWDFAGTVTAAGPDVDVPTGSRVAGFIDGFDRDVGTYAEQLVAPVGNIAPVPDGLDLVTAAAVPLNGLAGAQLVDLLGDGGGRRLLVTGAAGAVGGYVVPLAQDRGWRVTGLARPGDEAFVRSFGADFTSEPTPGAGRSKSTTSGRSWAASSVFADPSSSTTWSPRLTGRRARPPPPGHHRRSRPLHRQRRRPDRRPRRRGHRPRPTHQRTSSRRMRASALDRSDAFVGGEGGGAGGLEHQDGEAAGRDGVLGDAHAERRAFVGEEPAALAEDGGADDETDLSIMPAVRSV